MQRIDGHGVQTPDSLVIDTVLRSVGACSAHPVTSAQREQSASKVWFTLSMCTDAFYQI